MDLIVIYTPLQFMNAVAYTEQFKTKNKFLVLTTSKINIKEIKLLDVKNTNYYPFNNLNFIPTEIQWILKILYALLFVSTKKYNKIILGNYNNIISFILALKFQKKRKEIISVDDGLATINIYMDRNKENILIPKQLFGGKITHFLKKVISNKSVKCITFYSSFNLVQLYKPTSDKVVMQAILCNNIKSNNDETWFIGSPLVEYNILDKNQFKHFLHMVNNYSIQNKSEFKYILHRFEKEKDYIECIKFDYPIEFILNEAEDLPTEIVSFYSSALINIASMFPQIKCSYINLYKIDETRFEHLENIYKIFEVHNNLREFKL